MNEEFNLLVPFLNETLDYAYGAEFGMLFSLMKLTKRVKGYYCMANQEQITLAANRLGWEILTMKPTADGDWFYLHMRKRKR